MGKLSSAFEKTDTSVAYTYSAMNFIVMLGMLGIHFQIVNSYGDVILMGSYRMGNGQTLTLSPTAPFAPPLVWRP